MSKYIPCPNCFGAGKVGDPITGMWKPCQICAGVGTVEVLKPIKRTNLDNVIEKNKYTLKKLILSKCCVDPETCKLERHQSFSQCKYCIFGKEINGSFECNTDALEKWLDEEVKE